ncbi:hypothetical protein RJG79_09920 [Mycoplasmatota bacterium WC44]
MQGGDYMAIAKKLENNYGNFITRKELIAENINNKSFEALIKHNILKRSSTSVYYFNEDYRTIDLEEVNKFEDKSILSFYSAIYYHNLSTHIPKNWDISIVNNKRPLERAKNRNLRYHYSKPEFFELGLLEVKQNRNLIRIYDLERTVCDVIKNKKKIDSFVYGETIRNYFNNESKNIKNLKEYSRKLKIEDKVQVYLEVLYGY